MKKKNKAEQWKCDIFNAAFKPGDRLLIEDDFGKDHEITLMWGAWVMGGENGTAVARAEDWDTYLLERFKPLKQ